MAQIAIHHNPFHLHQNVDLFEPRIGQTVRGWLDERGIAEFSKPTLCLVDGEPVLRKDWALVVKGRASCFMFGFFFKNRL